MIRVLCPAFCSIPASKMSEDKYDGTYKILIVGNSQTGKTAFLTRYCDNVFNPTFVPTVGVDFRVQRVVREGKAIKLQIWDTAGQERYRSITTSYFCGGHGFIVTFDLSNEESFLAVKKWVYQVKELALTTTQLFLVGNKSDLTESRVITREQGVELAQSLGMEYFETSAKEDINVRHTFETFVDLISARIE